MNRNIYLIAVALMSIVFVSCNDTDDETDYEWKKMNEDAFNAFYNNNDYYSLESASKDGRIFCKSSDELKDNELASALKTTANGTPEYTDSVTVRYEGWYYEKDGSKYIFDTTEGDYNRTPRSFAVSGVIDGWSTALQSMEEGEELEIVIPWILGYGSTGTSSMPGYTTLYFRVKLLKILPMTGRS